MSPSSDIPRPPRTDAGRRLLASHPPPAKITPAAEPDVAAIPEQRVVHESPPWAADATQPASQGVRRIRASDAEREDAVHVLHRALGEGRLDLQEAETRVTAAYATVYRDELPALLHDLPQHDDTVRALTGGTAPDWQTLWTAVVWRARVSLWDEAGAQSSSHPPGPHARRTAALLLALAGLWVMILAVIGAAL